VVLEGGLAVLVEEGVVEFLVANLTVFLAGGLLAELLVIAGAVVVGVVALGGLTVELSAADSWTGDSGGFFRGDPFDPPPLPLPLRRPMVSRFKLSDWYECSKMMNWSPSIVSPPPSSRQICDFFQDLESFL
jgi:hypothetical protein